MEDDKNQSRFKKCTFCWQMRQSSSQQHHRTVGRTCPVKLLISQRHYTVCRNEYAINFKLSLFIFYMRNISVPPSSLCWWVSSHRSSLYCELLVRFQQMPGWVVWTHSEPLNSSNHLFQKMMRLAWNVFSPFLHHWGGNVFGNWCEFKKNISS